MVPTIDGTVRDCRRFRYGGSGGGGGVPATGLPRVLLSRYINKSKRAGRRRAAQGGAAGPLTRCSMKVGA